MARSGEPGTGANTAVEMAANGEGASSGMGGWRGSCWCWWAEDDPWALEDVGKKEGAEGEEEREGEKDEEELWAWVGVTG